MSNIIDFLHRLLQPVMLLLAKTRVKYRVTYVGKLESLPGIPIIYVVNHSNAMDIPVTLRAVKKHTYVFLGKQRLPFMDRLFFWLNGAIWVDRKDKEDMRRSKTEMQKYLKRGRSLLVFPEGTWNLTDAGLMLHMKWGVIDVAMQTGAQIIPLTLDYDRSDKSCVVSFGTPRRYGADTDKAEAIRELRDTMASMRWSRAEQRPILSRETFDPSAERADLWAYVTEYPKLDIEYERSIVFQPWK